MKPSVPKIKLYSVGNDPRVVPSGVLIKLNFGDEFYVFRSKAMKFLNENSCKKPPPLLERGGL